jgi:tetratricopeptide (TPR) repeat protein
MEQAHHHFARAVSMNPEYADGYYNLSLTYESSGNNRKAIEALEAAVENDPEGINARVRLAALYVQVGDLEKGRQMAREVLAVEPDNRDALHALGRASLALKEYEAAVEALERVIDLDPEFGPGYNDLAVVCIRMEPPDGTRAMELCRLAEENGAEVHPGLVEEAKSLAQTF